MAWPAILVKKIKSVNILWNNIIAYPSIEEFTKKINSLAVGKEFKEKEKAKALAAWNLVPKN